MMSSTLHKGVNDQLRDQYWRQGFVVIRGLFTPQDMDVAGAEFDRLFNDPNILREDSLRSASRRSLLTNKVLDRLDPIIDLSPTLRRLTVDPRLLAAVENVLGEAALLFKDKAIMKPPGAYGYGVHQDYTNWQELPVPPQFLLSALVAIDGANAANGALEVYPGLHEKHLRPPEKPSDIFNPSAGLVAPELLADIEPVMTELDPGDVVLFSSLAPHFSGPNQSDRKRRTLFLSYAAARFGDVYDIYYDNFYGYLKKDREIEPGVKSTASDTE